MQRQKTCGNCNNFIKWPDGRGGLCDHHDWRTDCDNKHTPKTCGAYSGTPHVSRKHRQQMRIELKNIEVIHD